MSTIIKDGSGQGFSARVDADNRIYTRTVNENEFEHAVRNGRAFNINTEFISITTGSTSEQAILYLKNNEDNDIVLTGWFIGTANSSGTTTGVGPLMKVYYNPTGGSIISDASEVTVVNRQAGSSNTFDLTVYKATGSEKTITGFETTPVLFQTQAKEGRTFGSIYLSLRKGASLGVVYIPNGAQPVEIYTGFQGFLPESFNFGE